MFELQIPTKVYFGQGILEDAIGKEKRYLNGSVMLVATGSAKRTGTLDRVKQYIEQLPDVKEVLTFTGLTANPKVGEVNEGIAAALRENCNVIVGLGGGSAIDAAKAIAAGAGAGETIDRFFFGGEAPGEMTLPIIAIPTTAGTGSELSKSGILSCMERQIKTGVRGERLYPKVAIVDPELTYTVPRKSTMETGFDVFTHATESYISKASNYFTEALSVQAMGLVSTGLRQLAVDLSCAEAREKLSYASMIMGINLGNASTVLPHRMQYPVGALTDTGHGIGLAALYPAWVELTYAYSPEKFGRIGELLSGHKCATREEVLDALLEFMDATCGRKSLRDFGFVRTDAERLASMVTGNIALDPAGSISGIVRSIYERALS